MKRALIFALILAGCFIGSCPDKSVRPSVIIITLDTVRADHLSLYGYPRQTTPFLEELAKESVVFNQAYTPITHTVPAHTSIFTAAYPSEHKVLYNGWKLKDWDKPVLAEVLKKERFQTGAVLGSKVLRRHFNLNRGFQFYQDENWEHHLTVKRRKQVYEFYQRRAEEVIRHSQAWLNSIKNNKPFFLWMHFYDAHFPFDLPPEFPGPFKLDEEYSKYLDENHYLLPEEYEHANIYDNELFYLDKNLEKFFGYLKAQGLLDKTLIIITSDHGEGLGQHNLYGHDLYFFQEQAHIPLLIRFPDKYQAGRRIDASVSLIDIAPTVLEFLKVKDKMAPSGSSFLGLIKGEKKELRPCQFFERRWYEKAKKAKGRKAGALCGEWKAVWADEEAQELYRLTQDPFELTNLRDSEKKKYLELETEIKTHLDQVGFFSVTQQAVPKEVEKELKALGYVK